MIAAIDFETHWNSKTYTLSSMGPIEYIRDPRFHAQMVGFRVVTQDGVREGVVATEGRDDDVVRHALLSLSGKCDTFVAHNGAGFDFMIMSERFGIRPTHLWDTIYMMRWVGLSSITNESHAALTEILDNGVKRPGTTTSDGKEWPADFYLAERADFMAYCSEDVAQCAANARKMLPHIPDDALRFMSITARMATEPVFVFDAEALEAYIKHLDEQAEKARLQIMEMFHFATLEEFFKALRSAARFADMLRSLGVEPPMKRSDNQTDTRLIRLESALVEETDPAARAVYERQITELKRDGVMTYAFSKQDVEFLNLREHEDPRVRLLVETRLEFNSSVMRSRAETMLKFARMGKPVPVTLSAFSARTGRYTAGSGDEEHSSDKLQWQNLSKRNKAHAALRKAIRVPEGYKVVAVDSCQVEARVNAWFCGQEDLVQAFRDGRDPYAELAEMFGNGMSAQEIHDGAKTGDTRAKMLRNAGKQGILSCGYGVGAVKYANTLWQQGTKFHSDYRQHCELARNAHSIYRHSNAYITRMWDICQRVVEDMAIGGSGWFGGPDGRLLQYGPVAIMHDNRFVVPTIVSPSGFHLRYPNLRAVPSDKRKVEYVYDARKGKRVMQTRLYGGKLLENIIQHLAFFALVWQACRMDERAVPLKGNNHDCFYSVVPEARAEDTARIMLECMRMTPVWLKGCPIDAEAEIGDDFSIC